MMTTFSIGARTVWVASGAFKGIKDQEGLRGLTRIKSISDLLDHARAPHDAMI
jgi:hypothetical protein